MRQSAQVAGSVPSKGVLIPRVLAGAVAYVVMVAAMRPIETDDRQLVSTQWRARRWAAS